MLMHMVWPQRIGGIRIIVVITTSSHLRWGDGAFSARHRFHHAFQGAGVDVHVLGAFSFASSVIVDYVVLVVHVVRIACLTNVDHSDDADTGDDVGVDVDGDGSGET